MSWITLTAADLEDARVAELVTAAREQDLAVGQTDPVPRRIQTIVDELRRAIRFGGAPLDIDAAKIPAGLKELAVEKIVRALKGRLLLPLTDDEKEAEKLYQRRLEQLSRGEWPVDVTDTPESTVSVTQPTASEVVDYDTRRVSRDDLRGL